MDKLKKAINDYLLKKINAKNFEIIYIDEFQSKSPSFFCNLDEGSNLALSKIFSAVSRFYDGNDPDETDLGENELYSEVEKWYKTLA